MKAITIALAMLLTLMIGCANEPAEVGPAGPTGRDGIDGRDGQDADSVTVVKLCEGETTYPSVFVEVAFCIGGKLYATYSANGGFSTEIPPGVYQSNAIGSRCSFTVLPKCQISN